MLLYTSPKAPNPRRVHVFLREKSLEVEFVEVDLASGAHFAADYAQLNPDGVVPTLVLDDGTALSESVSICRYLEEHQPEPRLLGASPTERALVDEWTRRLEIQLYFPVQDALRNSRPAFAERGLPGFRGGVPQIPELVSRAALLAHRTLGRLDQQLSRGAFVVGDAFSLADIVGATTLEFAQRTRFEPTTSLDAWPNVARWFGEVTARPSFAA